MDEDLLVLYGSQTGTSIDVAERVCRDATRRHIRTRLMAMDDYPVQRLIHEHVVIFVCATTGQGEAPDNMRRFWRFLLRKNLPADSLTSMQYAVFGLGDSSYRKFNFVAKKLQKRLDNLGASSFVEIGLADDQHPLGVDGALVPWLDELWQQTARFFPPTAPHIPDHVLLPSKYHVEIAENSSNSHAMETEGPELQPGARQTPPDALSPYLAPLVRNTRLTAESHFQDVRHIVFDVSKSPITYSPGDVLYIMPQNRADYVSELLDWLGYSGKERVMITSKDHGPDLPKSFGKAYRRQAAVTLRELLQCHLNCQGVPRRYFFELLSHFAGEQHEVERLQEFGSVEGQEDLIDYCIRMKRNCLETLRDFPSTKGRIPLNYLLDLFTPQQPRAFSISSSPAAHAGEIHITMAVVRYKTRMAAERLGVCSTWLAGLDHAAQPQPHCQIWVQKGTFRLPKDASVPLIMVGPGTGVAPFRSIIHERVQAGITGDVLIFGNRNEAGDFLYKDEWRDLERQGKLVVLTAFSRDQPHKIYVQQRIRENAQQLWPVLSDKQAVVLVAGNSKNMPEAVRDAFADVAMQAGGLDFEQSRQWIKALQPLRYQEETWS